jgi:hypothetical protein
MYPSTPKINISIELLQPLGKWAYRLNDVEHSPTLELVRGRSYNLKIDVPKVHQLWIKTSLGVGMQYAYDLGIVGNGTNDIKWRVDENTPSRLLYQSFSAPEIAGCISITDKPPSVNASNLSFPDIERQLDALEASLPSSPKELAGRGLRLNGQALELIEPNRNFLTDENDVPYTTSSLFGVSSDRPKTSSMPISLQDWLDSLASEIARIKGTPAYDTSSVITLRQLKERLDSLDLEVRYLEQRG